MLFGQHPVTIDQIDHVLHLIVDFGGAVGRVQVVDRQGLRDIADLRKLIGDAKPQVGVLGAFHSRLKSADCLEH